MRCPFCRHPDSRVVDSREADEGAAIRRRRSCQSCGRRFTTVEEASLRVLKRSGAAEPFSRAKVVAGVRKACQGRPVRPEDLALLAQRVEDAVRSSGAAEVPAEDVGRAILGPLRELDEVAYLRFASVYLAFESLADFEGAIARLRAHPPAELPLAAAGPSGPSSPSGSPGSPRLTGPVRLAEPVGAAGREEPDQLRDQAVGAPDVLRR
jgi:transcriptional repressor NrdR